MRTRLFFTVLMALSVTAQASDISFSGAWSVDLRTPQEQKQKIECGTAEFRLIQKGQNISGSPSFATPGCGRLDEGGEDSVKGVAIGDTAVLTVRSGRNGAIVLGKATRSGTYLDWQILDTIQAGESGDSPLILHKARLTR